MRRTFLNPEVSGQGFLASEKFREQHHMLQEKSQSSSVVGVNVWVRDMGHDKNDTGIIESYAPRGVTEDCREERDILL